jgi:hypothetical protein
MLRRLVASGVTVAAVLTVGCGGSSAVKQTPPTVPDPNGITVPKPAGGGPKAG